MEKDQEYSKLLDNLISSYARENRFLEFKSNAQDADRLGKYISALSNGACLEHKESGYLFFGVEDETLRIKGTTFSIHKEKVGSQALELYLRQYVTPKIDFKIEEFHYNGDKTLPITVFVIPAAVEEPTCYKSEPYIRVDSHVTSLKEYSDWMRSIYNSRVDWTSQIVEEASLADLDEMAIVKARKGFKERFPDKAVDVDSWDDQIFLDRAKITINGKVTRSALLLLGKEESVHRLNHISQIVWRLNSGEEQAADIFSIPFLLSTDKVLAKIRNYRFKIYPNNSLIPAEVWKYDTKTILEALHNCIAHQDYARNSRIVVTEERDCLKFANAGMFFDGNYKDYIQGKRTPVRYRNQFLVQAMVNLKMIDTQGFGIHSMFLSQKNRYLPMPDYDGSTEDSVELSIPGNVIDENYSKMLLENTAISLEQAVLLDSLQKHKPLTDDALKMLKKERLIEGRGRNVFISKYVAKATDAQTEYSKAKGLSNVNYKNIILDDLKDHGQLSKKQLLEMLMPHLPNSISDEQKRYKVENLLSSMRRDGVVIFKDKKWELVKDASGRIKRY